MRSVEYISTPLPAKLVRMLEQFAVERRSGNIQLNIKQGNLVGFKAEGFYTLE